MYTGVYFLRHQRLVAQSGPNRVSVAFPSSII